jgi:Transposase DDE domain
MLASPDQQISLTDPDARSMATSGRGSVVVGYNVQVAVDTGHHLIITYEVTNVGTDRSQLAQVAKETKVMLETKSLDVVADRGYFSGEEILACEQADITVTLQSPARAIREAPREQRQSPVPRPVSLYASSRRSRAWRAARAMSCRRRRLRPWR